MGLIPGFFGEVHSAGVVAEGVNQHHDFEEGGNGHHCVEAVPGAFRPGEKACGEVRPEGCAGRVGSVKEARHGVRVGEASGPGAEAGVKEADSKTRDGECEEEERVGGML